MRSASRSAPRGPSTLRSSSSNAASSAADPGEHRMKAVVVGASSGLGRCIGVGLGQRGEQVALLARRKERLEEAAKEAGTGTGASAVAIACDVTDESSCAAAIDEAARALGGIDALIYTP